MLRRLRERVGGGDGEGRRAAEMALLEEQIRSINRFPDQNPNPVLRTDSEGRLLYANSASAPITRALGVAVGDSLPAPLFTELRANAAETPPRPTEVVCGLQTFALLPVHVADLGVFNLYGTEVTAAKVVEKFPDRNPNPVLRTAADGTLIYANPASLPIIAALGLHVGDPLPTELQQQIRRCLEEADAAPIEWSGGGRTYALTPVLIPEFGFTNVYGTDITALRAVDKFPNENPNPVLRVSRDRVVTYANPASDPVRRAWGIEVGDRVDDVLFSRLEVAADPDSAERLEVEHAGRVYSLKVVSVYEFDSINLYGTDVTADRENERLLLNILPASIAERLKHEPEIADDFDEMTVLFADVVDFTPFAAGRTAKQVIGVLREIFATFDRLAERYGLETIKMTGDAYMVIAAPTGNHGHVDRVADMAIEMTEAMRSYREAGGAPLEIRVGMHVGPTIAGVIRLRRFIYDVWGDTVNTASRMESSGVPGRVHVSEDAHRLLVDRYELEPRGTVDVKGKGPMATYFLVRRRPTADSMQSIVSDGRPVPR